MAMMGVGISHLERYRGSRPAEVRHRAELTQNLRFGPDPSTLVGDRFERIRRAADLGFVVRKACMRQALWFWEFIP
jgi:hypothetical protein